MRHVDPPDPPWGWQTHVLKAGRAWLKVPGKDNRNAARPAPLWLKYRDEIGEKFAFICCYTVVYVANGQADHFIPWDDVKGSPQAHLAYQWSNLRYSDGWINQSKGNDRLPDPFVVQDDWFERLNFISRPWSFAPPGSTLPITTPPSRTSSSGCGTIRA